MKLKLLIISVAASAVISAALATIAPITYDTTTGIVVTDPKYPFNFPNAEMVGPVVTVFNVKSAPYNAKGDGITDDTTAIQTAITAAASAGGTVYLPGGTYLFSSGLSANTGHGCIIQGAGKNITILSARNTTATLITLGGTNGAPYSAIRDLTIDASGANSPSAYALLLYNSSFSEVSNIHVLNAYAHGIGFTSCNSLRIHDSVIEGSRTGYGILTNDSDCSGTTISHCSVLNSFLGGIQISQSRETVDHCYISGTSTGPYAGIYVARGSTGARNCTISNNIIQSCGSVGIDVSFGTPQSYGYGTGDSGPDISEGIIVVGNNCSNNNGGAMSTASNGTIIANNIFKDNGANPYGGGDSDGIGVVDARNVIITGNIIGNSTGVSVQKYGIIFRYAYDNPINDTVIDNDLRGNSVGPIISENNAGTIIALSTGHIFSHNRGLDDGVLKKSANYAVTSADQGATLTNTGATGTVTFTLPPAEEGLTYTFAVYPNQTMTIAAQSNNYIFIGNAFSSLGGSISNALNGSTITLKGVSTGTNARWYAIAHEGTWTLH